MTAICGIMFKQYKAGSCVYISDNIEIDFAKDTVVVGGDQSRQWSTFRLYHFMSHRRFKQAFMNGSPSHVTFVSPQLWSDSYEKAAYEHVAKWCASFLDMYCFCTCHSNSEAIEAMFRNYGTDADVILRLSIDVSRFIDELDAFGHRNEVDVYVSLIDYSLSQDEIQSNIVGYTHNDVTPTTDECVQALSHKRKAFSYEHEVRFFLVTKSQAAKKFITNNVLSMPISGLTSIVSGIMLPPHDPRREHRDKMCASCPHWISQDVAVRQAEQEIKQVFPKLHLCRSRLYEW